MTDSDRANLLLHVPCERKESERRAALDPGAVQRLAGLGIRVRIEEGLGERSGIPGSDYEEAGAEVVTDREKALGEADVVVRVHPPVAEEVGGLKRGAVHLSFMDPFNQPELIAAFAMAGVTAASIEMIPRTTLAQKMDGLSSQASLAGYAAVIQGAGRLPVVLPMMMTPAGTLPPARVFVIGAGVAGLQAIATAKRLGARVEAFDTRPEVEEQVASLGAKFVKVDLGETGRTAQGYARALTEEQLEMQRKAMAGVCAKSDLVVTTAKVFGRKAPLIVTGEMVAGMRPGSVIVDLAAETGGNVAGTVVDQEVLTDNGVRIIGTACLEGTVARHATRMFASNVASWIEHFFDAEAGNLQLDFDDEILAGCTITHAGAVVHPRFKDDKED